METKELKIATSMQANIIEESNAIIKYNSAIAEILESDLEQFEKEEIIEELEEIIGDELNHIEKLTDLYTMLTDIKPKEE